MFLHPRLFNESLNSAGLSTEVYDAMKNDDLAEVVMVALHVLRQKYPLPDISKAKKCEIMSNSLRDAGNKFLSCMNYKSALYYYNKALACAPNNSKEMALAYSNRSFIMIRLKRFQACVSDIDRCFLIGCPDTIKQKLLKRREDASQFVHMDSLSFTSLKGFTNNYLSCNTTCHTDVPFVSQDVNVAIECSQTKITASKIINSGTIIAREEPYMTCLNPESHFNTCYYCLLITPNLIPCTTCCNALFCSEKCRRKCNKEYHNYECHMVHVIEQYCNGGLPNLMIKSVLKLRSKLKWSDFIKESRTLGNSRLNISPNRELFNSANDCSLLSFSENRPFVYGVMYNASFLCAALMHYMSKIPGFMPNSDKDEALRALARIMMFLSIYGIRSDIVQTVTDLVSDKSKAQIDVNFGYYLFYGRLNTNCKPNVIVSWLNKTAVLIAIRKIKPGEELCIWSGALSNISPKKEFNIQLLVAKGKVCSCLECTNGVNKDDILSSSQKAFVQRANLHVLQANFDIWNVSKVLDKTRKVLDVLSDVQNSEEYKLAFLLFRNCVMACEVLETENFIIA